MIEETLDPQAAMNEQDRTHEQAMAVVEQWTNGARELIHEVYDERATDLYWRYLAADTGTGTYEARGLRLLAPPYDQKLVLVPVLGGEDTAQYPKLEMFKGSDPQRIAHYEPDRPGKILFAGQADISPQWRGILLLHEVAHADTDFQDLFREGTPLDHWQEEVNVFQFEHGLMAKLGGTIYQDFVAKEVQHALGEYDDNGGNGGKIPLLSSGPELDQAFGPAASEYETRVRRIATWFDVVYQMFEQKYGPEQGHQDKLYFTRGYYGKNS